MALARDAIVLLICVNVVLSLVQVSKAHTGVKNGAEETCMRKCLELCPTLRIPYLDCRPYCAKKCFGFRSRFEGKYVAKGVNNLKNATSSTNDTSYL